jgi:hypothetical protein
LVVVLALVEQRAIADPTLGPQPNPFLEAMMGDNRPLRQGFTFEVGFGGSLTYVARELADGHLGVGPTTLAVGAGVFITPKLALLARLAGTTYFDKNVDGETTQIIHGLGGIHLQYWVNDAVSLSTGPAIAVVGANPLLAADGSAHLGVGGSSRVGYSLFSSKHHVLRLSWETFNTKISRALIFGSALSFEWQY